MRGEYSTSGIIKSYPSGYFYGIGRQEKLHRLGNNELCRYRICVFSRLLVIQLAGIYRKMECPQTRESAIGIVRAVDISRQRENSSKHICLILLHSFFSFQFLELRGVRFLRPLPQLGMDFGVRSHTDFPLHKTKTLPIVAPYFQYKGNKLGCYDIW